MKPPLYKTEKDLLVIIHFIRSNYGITYKNPSIIIINYIH